MDCATKYMDEGLSTFFTEAGFAACDYFRPAGVASSRATMVGDGLEKSMSVDLETHYRALESMYLSAPLNAFYQPSIRVWDAGAEISIQVVEKFFHSGGAMHGSVYFKMLDDAAFFAANSVENQYFVLTADFRIDLLRPERVSLHQEVPSSVLDVRISLLNLIV